MLSEILGLTRGKYAWMQQGYVSVVMLPAPRQMMRHFFWLLCPAPDAAPESVGDVACSLAPSSIVAPPRGEKQLGAAAFPVPTGPWKQQCAK